MPNNWLAVDANLPDLSRVTNPKEQIKLLYDYMVELTEQLRFSLNNLTSSNWNTAALNTLKTEFGDDALQAVNALENRLNSLQNSYYYDVAEITGNQEDMQEDIRQLQEDAAYQEAQLGTLEQGQTDLETQVAQLQADVDELRQIVDALTQLAVVSDTGLQLGAEGKELRLVGNVYINGVLLQQEGENE